MRSVGNRFGFVACVKYALRVKTVHAAVLPEARVPEGNLYQYLETQNVIFLSIRLHIVSYSISHVLLKSMNKI